jgi:hypothetical protein
MDCEIVRCSLNGGFRLKKLMQFEESPALTTAGSALLASIGGLVTSSLTNQPWRSSSLHPSSPSADV